MQTTIIEPRGEVLPFATEKPVSELTLVEIAEQLEKVTGWIEAQRVRERDARRAYEQITGQVESNVDQIRRYANELLAAQRRRMNAFDGLLGKQAEPPSARPGTRSLAVSTGGGKSGKKNILDAIYDVWSIERYAEPLTTEDIIAALPDTGYTSNAAASSLKSSVNQALAKLCKVGRVVRLRADGSVISPKDKTSRARKYLAAHRLPEDQIL
ncbi:MAG: hypothetical protein KF787_12195 [Phycisphaeraceae bacterium]|nr:hypothetical protein [Phycisphaerae bacterium]MBX3393397.1 hypothetical protein [Phycisphaeraceae bacterium]